MSGMGGSALECEVEIRLATSTPDRDRHRGARAGVEIQSSFAIAFLQWQSVESSTWLHVLFAALCLSDRYIGMNGMGFRTGKSLYENWSYLIYFRHNENGWNPNERLQKLLFQISGMLSVDLSQTPRQNLSFEFNLFISLFDLFRLQKMSRQPLLVISSR